MALAGRRAPTDVGSFLAWEERQKLRHELIDGVVHPMGGGTRARERIGTNVLALLPRQLEGTPRQRRGSDLDSARRPRRSSMRVPASAAGGSRTR